MNNKQNPGRWIPVAALVLATVAGGCAVQRNAAVSDNERPAQTDHAADTHARADSHIYGISNLLPAAPQGAQHSNRMIPGAPFHNQAHLPEPDHVTTEADTAASTDTAPEDGIHAADAAPTDLWERLRAGFRIPPQDRARVRAEAEWYASHPAYIARTVERARPYLYLIVEALEQRDMPLEIALLPIVESAFQPFAYSHGRAAGLWQFIPATARLYGLKQNWWYDGRRDVLASTDAALNYLEYLQRKFDGDWLLALASYNSGSGTVKRAIRINKRRGRPLDFWSLQLPRETRAYVPKLLALVEIFADPERFDITLADMPNEPYVTVVHTGSQIDLAKAAELADMSLEDLYRLNPAYNRWATDPEGPHRLLLPIEKAAAFSIELAALTSSDRIEWARHRIRPGETLGHIAQRYRTTVGVLRQVNDIDGHLIRAGRSLVIPVATKGLASYTLSQEQRRKAVQNTRRRGTRLTYEVRQGDTLWDIARKYRVSVHQLARWNAMAPRDFLRPGQELVIWQQGRAATASVRDILNQSHPLNNVTRRINYVVRKGDSLARISQRFNVKISELRNWNSLPKDKYIQPGQRLTLYVDVTNQTESI